MKANIASPPISSASQAVVARMQRSEIRGILDSAALHPGYKLRAIGATLQ